jgi:hypothetical protein
MNSIVKILALLLGSFLIHHQTQAQVNVALNKRATQLSDHISNKGGASNAVDGITDGRWQSGSVTHTKSEGEKNPWWTVDLGEVYEISKIRIWNRTDCCAERLDNFKILVKSQPSGESWRGFVPGTQRNTGSNPLVFEGNAQGRYVMIQLVSSSGILSLAEVEVYGTKAQSNQPPAPGVSPSASAPNTALTGRWVDQVTCHEYMLTSEIMEFWVDSEGNRTRFRTATHPRAEMGLVFKLYDDYQRYMKPDQDYRRDGYILFGRRSGNTLYGEEGAPLSLRNTRNAQDPNWVLSWGHRTLVRDVEVPDAKRHNVTGLWKEKGANTFLTITETREGLRVEESSSPRGDVTRGPFFYDASCTRPNRYVRPESGSYYQFKSDDYFEFRKADGTGVKNYNRYSQMLGSVNPDGATVQSQQMELTQGVKFYERRNGRWVQIANSSIIRQEINSPNIPTSGHEERNEHWFLLPMENAKTYQFEVFSDEFDPRIAHARKYQTSWLVNDWHGGLGDERAMLYDFRPPLNQKQWIVVSTISRPGSSQRARTTGSYTFNFTEYQGQFSMGSFGEYSEVAMNAIPRLNQEETYLYLNFDGFALSDVANSDGSNLSTNTTTGNTSYRWGNRWIRVNPMTRYMATVSPDVREARIQHILFKTAEMFAPFNVVVARRYGQSNFRGSRNHSTVFIGVDTRQNVNYGVQYQTMNEGGVFFDFGNKELDMGWVNRRDATGWETLHRTIAHEGGHAFGLLHVRTNGSDIPPDANGNPQSFASWAANGMPGPVCPGNWNGTGTRPEGMSYNSDNAIFEDIAFDVTGWNNDRMGRNNPNRCGGNLSHRSSFFPTWKSSRILKQNSYRYLGLVLGARRMDDVANVADRDAIMLAWERKAVGNDIRRINEAELISDRPYRKHPTTTLIDREGDYDVFLYQADADKTLRIECVPVDDSPLDPILLLYDETGKNMLAYDDNGSDKDRGSLLQFVVKRGHYYKIVVGAKDNLTTGKYKLTY